MESIVDYMSPNADAICDCKIGFQVIKNGRRAIRMLCMHHFT